MRARVSQLHRTEAEWNLLPEFKPFSGEIIVFNPDDQYDYVRIKIGDGKTSLRNLPFIIDSAITARITGLFESIDAGRITEYKK